MSKHGYTAELADDLYDIGEIIAHRMRDQIAEDHTLSGALRDSIRCEAEHDADGATVYIYADAKADNGAMYAEFLEHGTGIYNENGDGRQTPWRYPNPYEEYDENGNRKFITTRGQKPTHFIRNAITGDNGLGPPVRDLIADMLKDGILHFVDAEVKMELNTLKYKR
jgi:hypothetical protein